MTQTDGMETDVALEPQPKTAVLLIAHGSRYAPANADLFAIAERIAARREYPIIEPSFLELAEPGIAEAGDRCVAKGAERVLMIPYFLSAGVHMLRDLTAARDDLRHRHPNVAFILGSALGPHPLLDALVVEKIRDLGSGIEEGTERPDAGFAERFAPMHDDAGL